MEGQKELNLARDLRDQGVSALNLGNSTEAKQKLSQALNYYNNCLQEDLPAYGPNNRFEIEREKVAVEERLRQFSS